MRNLDDQDRLSFGAIFEIRQAIKGESARLAEEADLELPTREGVMRRPKPAYYVNWMLSWFFSLRKEDRDRIVLSGKEIYERHVVSDTQFPFEEHALDDIVASLLLHDNREQRGHVVDPDTASTIDLSANAKPATPIGSGEGTEERKANGGSPPKRRRRTSGQ